MKKYLVAVGISLLCCASIAGSVSVLQTINLNKADVKQLMTLKGIGKKRAEAILAYRNKLGEFQNVDQLAKVSGITAAMVDKIQKANGPNLVLH